MIHRFLSAAVLAVVLLGATTGSAQTRRFDITIAGLPAGELVLSGAREGGRYEAGGTLRATGLVGVLSRLRYEGASTGRVAGDGTLVPVRHVAQSRSAGSERRTEILFENGAPARVVVAPPPGRQVDLATQAGTVDPVSAAFALLHDPAMDTLCNNRLDLFDGSRRSLLEVGRAEERDGTLVCNGRYLRLSRGGDPTIQAEYGFQLFFRPNGGAVELERIETRTRFGRTVATRRS